MREGVTSSETNILARHYQLRHKALTDTPCHYDSGRTTSTDIAQTLGMHTGPYRIGLSVVLWISTPAAASIVALQRRKKEDQLLPNLGNLSAQPPTMSSSAYLWVWSPLLHTIYTSSPNHYHPFATHVHTILTCFAVVATICPLFLVSLSTPYLKLYLSTSRHTSTCPFSSLPSEVPSHYAASSMRSIYDGSYCY